MASLPSNGGWRGGAYLTVRADARFVGLDKVRYRLMMCATRRSFGLKGDLSKRFKEKIAKEKGDLGAHIDTLLARMEAAAKQRAGLE